MEEVTITKLVNGGQGLARTADNRVVFVWNALPGEKVKIRLIKRKKSYSEAIAEEIVVASAARVVPKDDQYLATSPWQIMTSEAEIQAKLAIVQELMIGEKVDISQLSINFHQSNKQWHYRNKMEYSFWGDDAGLHLAVHERGSRYKQIVNGSSLAMASIDQAATDLIRQLEKINIRAGNLKTVVIRSSQKNMIAASLYVTGGDFSHLIMPTSLAGLNVYYSNPKSPASVQTELLHSYGLGELSDDILGKTFTYNVDSFFQVNIELFNQALVIMKQLPGLDSLVDMYSGVGTIGLSLASKEAILIEVMSNEVLMAQKNAKKSALKTQVIESSAEKAIDYIPADKTVIFDPPRAGLHLNVIKTLLDKQPPAILYLSCNPATLARDLKLLADKFELQSLDVFNFFPKTPHIECLAVLKPRAL